MSIWAAIGYSYLAIFCFMTLGWIVSLVKKEASVVDPFWGLGFVMLAWLHFVLNDGFSPRQYLISVLVTLWGVRLAAYIVIRSWGKGEDYRYRAMREAAGTSFWWRSYYKVFLLQSVLLGVVAAPILAGQFYPTPANVTALDIVGATIWGIGFLFEAVGDLQLYLFKRDPANKGKVMTGGLWAYTRHPNYFGETLIWWGLFLIALSAPYGYWSVIGPLLITGLLLRVSGVTLLEQAMIKRPGYKEYVERTNAFFPWFPKKPA